MFQGVKYNPDIFSIVDLDKIITSDSYYKSKTKGKLLSSEELGKLWWDTNVKINGYKLMDKIIGKLITYQKSFSTESTGKYFCPSRKIMRKSYRYGYNNIGICPYVPYYELKKRVEIRAQEEGRDLSLDELKVNMILMLNNILKIGSSLDKFYMLDNLVAKGTTPKIILTSTYDVDALDNTECCVYQYNIPIITNIYKNLEKNKNMYILDEIDVYNKELTFFKILLNKK
jgi:hypothetical protein